jgi:hypothetical protein
MNEGCLDRNADGSVLFAPYSAVAAIMGAMREGGDALSCAQHWVVAAVFEKAVDFVLCKPTVCSTGAAQWIGRVIWCG